MSKKRFVEDLDNERFRFKELANTTVRIWDTLTNQQYFVNGMTPDAGWQFCTMFMYFFLEANKLIKENERLKSEVEYHKLSCEIKDKNGYDKIVCQSCFSDLKLSRQIAYPNGEVYLEFDCTNCNRSYRIRKGNLYE